MDGMESLECLLALLVRQHHMDLVRRSPRLRPPPLAVRAAAEGRVTAIAESMDDDDQSEEEGEGATAAPLSPLKPLAQLARRARPSANSLAAALASSVELSEQRSKAVSSSASAGIEQQFAQLLQRQISTARSKHVEVMNAVPELAACKTLAGVYPAT